MNVHENALCHPHAIETRVCNTWYIHLFARESMRHTDRPRARDDNCAKSFGQARQQMVIDKAINHSFRSRELYWPLQALRVVLINVKPDVNVTVEGPWRHIIPFYAPCALSCALMTRQRDTYYLSRVIRSILITRRLNPLVILYFSLARQPTFRPKVFRCVIFCNKLEEKVDGKFQTMMQINRILWRWK